MRTLYQRLKKINKRWLTGCLLLFCVGCNNKKETASTEKIVALQKIEAAKKEVRSLGLINVFLDSIRSGDMITRTGNDFTSYSLRHFCQTDKTYSHCGIASIENDTVFVYHALGGEFNPDQQLLREPLSFFVAAVANNGFGVFRFNLTKTQNEKLLAETRNAYRQGITFDMQFDLATDEKMYCSEFTAKMFRRGMDNDTLFTVSRIAGFEFLAPDNLFTHPLCKPLYKAIY
jgi:hypothetical protein